MSLTKLIQSFVVGVALSGCGLNSDLNKVGSALQKNNSLSVKTEDGTYHARPGDDVGTFWIGYEPNSVLPMRDCLFSDGYGFVETNFEGKTEHFDKYSQNSPELVPCYQMLNNLADKLD